MPRQRPRLARQPWATSGLDDADSFGRTGMCKLTEAGKAVAVGGGGGRKQRDWFGRPPRSADLYRLTILKILLPLPPMSRHRGGKGGFSLRGWSLKKSMKTAAERMYCLFYCGPLPLANSPPSPPAVPLIARLDSHSYKLQRYIQKRRLPLLKAPGDGDG